MSYWLVGPTSLLRVLQSQVDHACSPPYPRWGVNAVTGQTYMPDFNQRVEDVYGVTLHPADVIPSTVDPNMAQYLVLEGYNFIETEAIRQDPMYASLVQYNDALPVDLFPEPPLFGASLP